VKITVQLLVTKFDSMFIRGNYVQQTKFTLFTVYDKSNRR